MKQTKMSHLKLFKVERLVAYEHSGGDKEWTKYFLASQESTVRSIVHERHGKPKWYDYDRCEVVYEIEEVEFEAL